MCLKILRFNYLQRYKIFRLNILQIGMIFERAIFSRCDLSNRKNLFTYHVFIYIATICILISHTHTSIFN